MVLSGLQGLVELGVWEESKKVNGVWRLWKSYGTIFGPNKLSAVGSESVSGQVWTDLSRPSAQEVLWWETLFN